MSDSVAEVPHQVGAVAIDHLGVLRALGDRAPRDVVGVGEVEHGRPLLELLVPALRPDERVGQAVDDLHAGPLARVARVGIAHELGPFLGRMLQAAGARLVGPERRRVRRTARGAGEGVPEYAAPASNTSGYDPTRTLVIMAPDEPPMTNTLDGSTLYFESV